MHKQTMQKMLEEIIKEKRGTMRCFKCKHKTNVDFDKSIRVIHCPKCKSRITHKMWVEFNEE